MADARTGDQADARDPEGRQAVEAAVAQALDGITPETRELRATAAATGRLLLAALTTWMDGEVHRAVTALNRDVPNTEDDDIDAGVAARLAGPGDPDTLVDVMGEVLETVGNLGGVDAVLWQRVRELAGDWFRSDEG